MSDPKRPFFSLLGCEARNRSLMAFAGGATGGSNSGLPRSMLRSRMLGLRHNVNLLVDYDPEWATEFSRESKRIADALGGSVKGIEHYGSTAVIGMRAKPIIDILVGVAPFEDWDACKAPLERLGYDYAAHAGVPGHYIFGRGRDTTERTHLVHVVAFLGEEWSSNIALRNALRVDEKLRAAYVAEKERAAAAAPEGRAKYNELKQSFIDKVKASLL